MARGTPAANSVALLDGGPLVVSEFLTRYAPQSRLIFLILSFVVDDPKPTSDKFSYMSGTGAVAGGQPGYRWQTGAWVFGVEGQGDWANLSGSNGPDLLAGGGGSNRSKINGFGVVTGQVGYAWSNVLLM